ncbi:TIGR03756 family integrating conjugative element protein [Pseudomonas juntendi]|uniref:TIGR03756 family integrating conjugative element protein n=1 Tax=Pseudomonas juntendi TaxID=2666183 RepID=A0A7W2R0B4_9PSED|nr:TIGR03756 family integrating conjugative element protein [Pseudomonas juntendi]MBA6132655.1 TIGR03756 family integrating conjugative element protein [Pseudomonas juntendi]MBA6149353.1 TIGR03756 family integrating conjugative element protein [Pseudomonas juntendi]
MGRISRLTLAGLLTSALPFSASAAISSAAIIASTSSPTCLEYKVVGVCYWLLCTPVGCTVKTSTKVRHYIPDAVVSAYANTGQNPWTEVSPMGAPNAAAQAGNDGTTNHNAENNIAKFKEADVIGHPGAAVFSRFASSYGYSCHGATTPYVPYMLSTLDTLAWRYGVPESVYPEALIPGMREVGGLLSTDMWGSVYPRSGFIHQVDDFKAGAVIAQRAGDVTTRVGQPHVYQPMRGFAEPGYWPAGELKEGDASTGKWQQLTPNMSPTCAVFPSPGPNAAAVDEAYAWTLWRPYSCCQRKGQTFLGSTDFQ